jgi:hypothetical protein
MSQSSYNAQILATVAAAQINGDGTSPLTYGCAITRSGFGLYRVILPTGEAQSNDASFTHVTCKGGPGLMASVTDETAYIKLITTSDSALLAGTVATDVSIEVVVERATINL